MLSCAARFSTQWPQIKPAKIEIVARPKQTRSLFRDYSFPFNKFAATEMNLKIRAVELPWLNNFDYG
jgi:hypothetical protein